MTARALMALVASLLAGSPVQAAPFEATILPVPTPPAAAVQPYVWIAAKRLAFTHVRLIDGTGAAPLEDMNPDSR